ncbi:MAG: cytochrome b561 domain-containing protein [Aliishimia sp.]
MFEWLLSPIDPARVHDLGFAVSWHARSMVLAWGVLAPLAVIIARFFKITPKQDWPRQLDNQFWWRCHLIGQSGVVVLSLVGLALIFGLTSRPVSLHGWLGYGVLIGLIAQVAIGVFRGDKGGPTAPHADGSLRGHHYDMTRWRRIFEHAHKALGYAVIALAMTTILFGLWHSNAPRWMWMSLAIWWPCLVLVFIILQKRGYAVDTYQAIWGDDPAHPGNQRTAPGWGVHRPGDTTTQANGEPHVRNDRGNRVRSP